MYLFEEFLDKEIIYNRNQLYWKDKFESYLKEKINSDNVLFENLERDGNPIFTFINNSKTKAVRIIQDDIKSIDCEKIDCDNYMIDSWIDSIYYDDMEISELVISLFMTNKTVDKAMDLIINYLEHPLFIESFVYL